MNSRSKRVQWELAAVPQDKAGSAGCYWSNKTCCTEDFPSSLSREQQGPDKSMFCSIENRWDDKLYPLNASQESSLAMKMRRALVLCSGLVLHRALSITPPKLQRRVTMFAYVKHIFQASTSRGDDSRCDCWVCQGGQPAPHPLRLHRDVQQCLTTGNSKSAARAGVRALPIKELSSLLWRPQ